MGGKFDPYLMWLEIHYTAIRRWRFGSSISIPIRRIITDQVNRAKAFTACAVVALLAVAGSASGVAQGDDAADTNPSATKGQHSPVPSKAKQQAALREVKQVFQKQYSGVRLSKKKKHELAGMMLADAMDTDADPMRYVLFSEALKFAVQSGDPQRSMKIVEAISGQYQVDELELALTTLRNLSTKVSSTDMPKLVDHVFARVDELARLHRYKDASKLLGGLRLRDKNVQKQITLKRTRILVLEKKWAKALEAARALKTDPDNPRHNLTLGRFLCFVKNDWRRGLPRLAKSSKKEWQESAKADLGAPSDPMEKVTVAEKWKKLALSLKTDEKTALLKRAKMWFEKAEPDLKGIAKRNVKQQISKIEKMLVASSGKPKPLRPGDTLSIQLKQNVAIVFRQIPAGQFLFGPKKQRATIAKPYLIGITEVTQGQWNAIVGEQNNPSKHKGNPLLPLNNINWFDSKRFIKALNDHRCARGRYRFRLPTSIEWEFACRANTETKFFFGDTRDKGGDYGWHSTNSKRKPHPVGTKKPNPWGLYDITGNVWEWSENKALHGSGFLSTTASAYTTFRFDAKRKISPNDAKENRGFRLVVEQIK